MKDNSKSNIKHSTLQKSSKIFVAGGTGLVGSAIIRKLLEKGYTNIISNYHKHIPNNSILNIEHSTLKINSVIYTKLDFLDSIAVSNFFKQEIPEFVFLAAAKVGGIVANNTYRADFIYENLQIQNNVIHQSYLHNVKKLLFLGSTCIYPKNCPQPIKEEYLLTSELEYTNEPYAIAKIAGIKMCESYNLQYGTNFISAMPTNLYGPNDNFDLKKSHVLPALIRKIHLGKCLENGDWDTVKRDLNENPIENIDGNAPQENILTILNKYGVKLKTQNLTLNINPNKVEIEIWGSGKPMREFLWSNDMADACVFLMENIDFKDILNTQHSILDADKFLNEVRNSHLNIGTGKDISIKNLAYLVKDNIGFRGNFYFNTNKPDGTMKKLTDSSKLHTLGWCHKVELQEGIEKLYKWYSNKESNAK